MTRKNPMTDLALVAVFAALIAAVTVWVKGFDIPGSSVPVTLQTLVIGLAAMVLGPWRGFLATLLYLIVGFAGLPVFAQGSAGIGVLAGPSAGYLLAFPLYAMLVGGVSYLVLRRGTGRVPGLGAMTVGLIVAGLVGSILVLHPLGILGMARNIPASLSDAVKFDMPFWPGDVIKTVVAGLIATAVHKAFPALALGSAAQAPVAEGARAGASAAR